MQDKLENKYNEKIRQLVPISCLSPKFQDQALSQAEVVMVPSGNRLFEQDGFCESLYFLLSGEVSLSQNRELVKVVSAGDESSRFAINKTPSYAAVAKSRVTLLLVNRSFLERLIVLDAKITPSIDSDMDEWNSRFLSSKVLAQIPLSNFQKALDLLNSVIVKKGDQVISQNLCGKYFYIIREGRCVVTKHNPDTNETITLANLGPGDYFGEEALGSNDKRSSSVTMQTTGQLMRLSRIDYEQLKITTSVKSVSFEEAESMVNQGAIWLDTRFKEEFSRSQIKNSHSFPCSQLEQDVIKLTKNVPYIVYCETGIRSAAAAGLLNEKGFNVSYLDGGIGRYPAESKMGETWLDDYSDVLREKETAEIESQLAEEQTKTFNSGDSMGEQIMAVDRQIKSLKEIFTSENILAQEWLQKEDSEEDIGILIEARKQMEHIDNIPPMPASGAHKKEGDSELKLLRQQLESAQNQIQEERDRITTSDTDLERKELTLKRVSDELEAVKNRLKEQETYEVSRRESFEQQLATERKKMREQLNRFSTGIEKQQSRSMEVEDIRKAAALETRQIIHKFKDMHEQYRLRQQKTIQTVRQQLQRQAMEVVQKARKAQQEKALALESLRTVQKQLNALKQKRASLKSERGVVSDVPLLVDVESMGKEIEQAKDRFHSANNSLSDAESEKLKHQSMLDKIGKDEVSIRGDLLEWFTSNAQFNIDRSDLTAEQIASHERVKRIAHEALEEAFNGKQRPGGDPDDSFMKNFK